MNIDEKDIERIIQEVLKNVENAIKEKDIAKDVPDKSFVSSNQMGVFDRIEDAIDASCEAQKIFVSKFKLKDRERFVNSIRKACGEQAEKLAHMVWEETKLGRYEDKILKHRLVIDKTPGPECLKPTAISGDDGLTIIEPAPFGLIGAITPVTNPTETIINNTISMISAGNGVVFNVHPSAKHCCAYAVDLINRTIVEEGGPANLISMVREPSLDTVKVLTESPKIKLLVGTGGSAMVRSLLQSGKKVIGAGAGNPPVVVDETADIAHAAKQIYIGASFDNNIICAAEKEVFVVEQVANDLIYNMVEAGAYLLSKNQLEQIMELVLTVEDKHCSSGCSSNIRREYHVKKEWVGKNAGLMLEKIGVQGKSDTRLLICEVPFDHPFVQLEQLMPVLPIVRCRNLDEAIGMAVAAEHGNRHTASMFSTNVNNLTRFAREIDTTIFVKNSATLAGFGFGGEGYATMTIAGPTGEGLTCAVSFTRQRRCVLADGGFRIV